MRKLSLPESVAIAGKRRTLAVEFWLDDACILDMDYFVKTLSGIKAKGVHPDLIGSIIAQYASNWLPDLTADNKSLSNLEDSLESVTASWTKKRFFVETLVKILPPEKDSVPCNFLLRLLRTANMVGVEPGYRAELEKRISWQLDQASLKEILIPAFSHNCETLLDVGLVLRLVKRFNNLKEATKSGAALVKVAMLVDCFLAEAAIDANLTLPEFMALAGALPSHARATDDGLYRAIDTYLKVHPDLSKEHRKGLCRLIDSRKLSAEASLHAAQNEQLPVRAVIHVLFSEHAKFNTALESPARCLSKRKVIALQMEIRKLQEEIYRLQSQINSMQAQIERLMEKKSFFKWRKLGLPLFKSVSVTEGLEEDVEEGEVGFDWRTPTDIKAKLVQGGILLKESKSIQTHRRHAESTQGDLTPRPLYSTGDGEANSP